MASAHLSVPTIHCMNRNSIYKYKPDPSHPNPSCSSSLLRSSSTAGRVVKVREKTHHEIEKEKRREVNRKIASQKGISIILGTEATKAIMEKKKPINSKKLLPQTLLESLHERITALR